MSNQKLDSPRTHRPTLLKDLILGVTKDHTLIEKKQAQADDDKVPILAQKGTPLPLVETRSAMDNG